MFAFLKQPRSAIMTAIMIGYFFMFLVVAGLGWYMTASLNELTRVTRDLYEHPFAVSNAAQEMKASLYVLRSQMLRIVLLHDYRDDIPTLVGEAGRQNASLRASLEVVKANFLGDLARVRELEAQLDQWDVIRADILRLAENGKFPEAAAMVSFQGTPKFLTIVPEVEYVLGFAKNRARLFMEEAENRARVRIAMGGWLFVGAGLFIFVSALIILGRVDALQKELSRLATTDALTGIANRRQFFELAERELAGTIRRRAPLVMAVADLDHFKQVNDTFGHQTGDMVLKRFGELCRASLRRSDIAGRVGGEEFAMVLPGTDLDSARDVIERLRQDVRGLTVTVKSGSPPRVTVSFGLAAYTSGDDAASLFARADQALYLAKRSGRDKVCPCPQETAGAHSPA